MTTQSPSQRETLDWCTRRRLVVEVTAQSLCWRGDDLVDWVGGGDHWTPDGTFHSAHRSWGYSRLDSAVSDRTGRWCVVHERTGTAGLLLHDGEIIREIHRSPYHADVYVFPVCLFAGPGDRMLLAHCPESYARIEIDDAETGARLTPSTSREEVDFFHSRLSASPNGKRLLSAGWIWHPWDAVGWFDVKAALADPHVLDDRQSPANPEDADVAEETSAAWLDDDTVLIGGSYDDGVHASADEATAAPSLRPHGLAVYDVLKGAYSQSVNVGYPPGTMMPVGRHHVVTFYEHPRLVSLASGRVVHAWPDIATGAITSSIVRRQPHPVLALDASRARFAVGGPEGIEVVTIDAVRAPV